MKKKGKTFNAANQFWTELALVAQEMEGVNVRVIKRDFETFFQKNIKKRI
jgi:hypothetical protein